MALDILIVDDEEDIRDLVALVLDELGPLLAVGAHPIAQHHHHRHQHHREDEEGPAGELSRTRQVEHHHQRDDSRDEEHHPHPHRRL